MGKETRIGALWSPSREGETMPLGSGNIVMPSGEKLAITVWRNRWKQPGERTPDFYIDLDTREKPAERADNPPPMEVRRVSPFSQDTDRPAFDKAFGKDKSADKGDEFQDIPF